MSEPNTRKPPDAETPAVQAPAEQDVPELLEADVLVEDLSIDGMCGVY